MGLTDQDSSKPPTHQTRASGEDVRAFPPLHPSLPPPAPSASSTPGAGQLAHPRLTERRQEIALTLAAAALLFVAMGAFFSWAFRSVASPDNKSEPSLMEAIANVPSEASGPSSISEADLSPDPPENASPTAPGTDSTVAEMSAEPSADGLRQGPRPAELESAAARPASPPAAAEGTAMASPPDRLVVFPQVPDPAIAAFVTTLNVSGVRSEGSESRAIINGKLYTVGEAITGSDLRFIAAHAHQLVFQDTRGAIYRKGL